MTDPRDFLFETIDPACAALTGIMGREMGDDRARTMLLAIAHQESNLEYRRQIRGPARGLWQFEKTGGTAGVLSHERSKDAALAICKAMGVEPEPGVVYEALAADDNLAACFARLLLWTDPAGFRAVVPWLILFATAVYAWSGRGGSAQLAPRRLPGIAFVLVLGCLGIYGGYFGGGNSFLVLALLAATGLSDRDGAAVKNVLVAVINLGAVVVFAFSGLVDWGHAVALGLGGLLGSWLGVRLLDRIDPRWVRIVVILCGLGLSGWFFATQAS